jgi:hypothetical protein
MEASVRALFERYERLFNRSLRGDADIDEVASLYAEEFIGAAPAGVRAARNDERFRQFLREGHARYRAIGTKEMRIRNIRLAPIDDCHCVAHVAWTATYAREGRRDIPIYLVRNPDGAPKIFGWVSGDEQMLLRRHGII